MYKFFRITFSFTGSQSREAKRLQPFPIFVIDYKISYESSARQPQHQIEEISSEISKDTLIFNSLKVPPTPQHLGCGGGACAGIELGDLTHCKESFTSNFIIYWWLSCSVRMNLSGWMFPNMILGHYILIFLQLSNHNSPNSHKNSTVVVT